MYIIVSERAFTIKWKTIVDTLKIQDMLNWLCTWRDA